MDRESTKRARPVGRTLRLLVGLALTALASLSLIGKTPTLLLATAGVALGAFVFYAGAHLLIARVLRGVSPWLGALLALVPLIVVFVLGGAAGRLGSVLFVGISLLLSAARADPGCEVMTLPAILFGNRTHLICIPFSPIDWLEEKLERRRSAS